MSEPPVYRSGEYVLVEEPALQGGEKYVSYSICRITTDDPETESNAQQVCWCPTKEDAELILAALHVHVIPREEAAEIEWQAKHRLWTALGLGHMSVHHYGQAAERAEQLKGQRDRLVEGFAATVAQWEDRKRRDNRLHEKISEVLDDLSGWDRSMWTQEQRLGEALTLLNDMLGELSGLPRLPIESSALLGVKLPHVEIEKEPP